MTFFDDVELAPPDPIYGLMAAFMRDPRHDKINLGIGIYQDERLTTPVMKAVQRAEEQIVKEREGKVYLPIDGDQHFLSLTGRLIYGESFWENNEDRIAKVQTLGGTGALRLSADFLEKEGFGPIYYPDPTWANHKKIFSSPALNASTYPYYCKDKKALDFGALSKKLEQLSERSVVVLHAVCHNPSGADLSREEWKVIYELCRERDLLPIFDFAYLGFGDDLEQDAWAIRYFAEKGMPAFVAFSASKNFGLYGERIGAFYYVAPDQSKAASMTSQLKQIVRARYSSPPRHGAALVGHVLHSAELKKIWEDELAKMRGRIDVMRRKLKEALASALPSRDFNYLEGKKGMFAFLGLKEAEVERLKEEYGIYMTADSRVNLSGLTDDIIKKVAHAVAAVSKEA